jgi:hypothetical protein
MISHTMIMLWLLLTSELPCHGLACMQYFKTCTLERMFLVPQKYV